MLAAVNFHYIRDDFTTPYPGIYGQTPEQFENQLKVLSSIASFVSAKDIKNHILDGEPLPERGIMITFDDGLQEQFTKALPILDRLNIPALFFTNTKPIDEQRILNVHKIHILRTRIAPESFRSMIEAELKRYDIIINQKELVGKAENTYRYDNGEQSLIKYLLNYVLDFSLKEKIINNIFLKEFGELETEICQSLYFTKDQMCHLADKGYLGCHSHSHYPIGLLSDQQKEIEIKTSKNILKNITGHNMYAFSFPFGSKEACRDGAKVLKNNDFVFSFTMERAINNGIEDPFYIARFDTNDVPGGKFYKYKSAEFFERNALKSWVLN